MKRQAKILMSLVLAVAMCFSALSVFASAEEIEVSPRLSHMGGGAFGFSALEDGCHATVSYEGYAASFVWARVTFEVQKRNLLVFWKDIGTWTATSTELWGYFYHIFEGTGKGTFRCHMTLEVLGTDGTYDVITDTRECTY